MGAVIKNGLGSIVIDNRTIAQTAAKAALGCDGIAGISVKRRRDGRVIMLGEDSYTKGIDVEIDENALRLGIHLTVDYGTDIPQAAEAVGNAVKVHTEESVGLSVAAVNIIIEGIRTTGRGK